ncbi:MAG: right-handed parallel beta-helix repeat-containing protein [candidate division WOR-3 bacterium]
MVKSISVLIIMLGMLVSWLIADTTYVSGIINTNTVWSPAGSPYVITGNVLVNTGVRLDIQPGVKVLFNYDKYIMVKGTLKAIGTEQDSIIFTALDTTQWWRRLWFKPEAFACSLKYCRISYACSSAIYNEDTLYIGYSTITNNSADLGGGGGIYNYGTATITNNTITNNSANYGGGIYNNYGTVTITNNTITNNSAYWGGGILNYDGTATITNNTITNNSAYWYGGGIDNDGTATITNNTITNNSANWGGGIGNYDGTATITNNTITNNSANYGGGIYNNYGTATITNNTITNNSADWSGGIYNYGTATITNNTITNNNANYYGGGIYNSGIATITNNTIIDSTASTIRIQYGSIKLNYNNLNNLNPTGYTVYNNTADTINARNNYWFTVDTLVIAQKIYDFWDDFNLGEVYYRPFLTAPVPGIEEKDTNETYSLPLAMTGSVKIFPNPAKSVIRVRAPFSVDKVTIYDVAGKIIKVQKFNGSKVQEISLDGIKNGVYFVKVNDAMVKEKLVITK